MRSSAHGAGDGSSARPATFRGRIGSIVASWRAWPIARRVALNRRAAILAAAILALLVAYQLVTLTWTIVLARRPVIANVPTASASAPLSPPQGSADEPSRAELFGHAAAEAAASSPPYSLPETRASLKVTGTLVGADAGRAIIASADAPEKTYELGEVVDGADGAILRAVHADSVVLARGDRLETLPFIRRPASVAASVADAPALGSAVADDTVSPGPMPMADVVRVAPFFTNGTLAGFRVSPGVERDGFAALGFEKGDIVTEIGGQKLDDTRRAQQFFAALERGSIVQATVVRNGLPRSLAIDPKRVVFRRPEGD